MRAPRVGEWALVHMPHKSNAKQSPITLHARAQAGVLLVRNEICFIIDAFLLVYLFFYRISPESEQLVKLIIVGVCPT